MQFGPIIVADKKGRAVVLRNAELTDADALIQFLKETTGETPFLLREAEEVDAITPAQEEQFVQSRIVAERELMLAAVVEGALAGICSLCSVGPFQRYRHRCAVSIALYQKFCGAGIGEIMLRTILNEAKQLGYEQAELDVIADNAAAIALYEKLGFEKCGYFPSNVKYRDGRYADAYWMMKRL